MTYSIEVIISQPMSLQFSHYRMIKMATKNSFYHFFLPLLYAIQVPIQQRVHHLRSCMRGTHCEPKVPLHWNRYNGYTIYLDLNRNSRLDLLVCLTDDTTYLHYILRFLTYCNTFVSAMPCTDWLINLINKA